MTVLERSRRPGGRMATVEHLGYRIDTAASVLSTGYGRMLALIAEAGLGDQIEPTNAIMAVLREGRIHRLNGLGLGSLLGTRLFSPRAKLALSRMLVDVARCAKRSNWDDLSGAADRDVESVAAYADRRLLAELSDYLIEPMCRGLYLMPPDQVSVVPLLFFLGVMAGRSFFSSQRGVGFLTEDLARRLHVEYEATVEDVEEHPGGVRVHWTRPGEEARVDDVAAAVLAVPAVHVPALHRGLTAPQTAFLRTGYSRSVVVSFGVSRPPEDEPAMWLNLPRGSASPDLAAVVLEHNKAPGRVPPGRGMITTFWMRDWSRRRWDQDDAVLAREAVDAARKVLPTLGDEVEMTSVRRWDPCVSVRPPGGYRALREFTRGLDPSSRIQLAGDYFTSISTNGSLCTGESAAARVARRLGGPGSHASER